MTQLVVTKPQVKALEKLASRDGGSAYSLRCTLGTLSALERKGYAKSKHGIGSIFSPHVNITWYITDAGRTVYRSNDRAK